MTIASKPAPDAPEAVARQPLAAEAASGEPDPFWYKDAVLYEVHVRAFYDSDGNGTGDFRGLTEKLDYLADLGITAIWLLPFYPSPLRDDGYDIADYTSVNPDYGDLRDARAFIREAHRRGLRVITELVCNHTSDQHPWFQRARHAPKGSPFRDFYVWSDTTERYRDARIIFKDTETSNWAWDPVANAYYWHRFFSHQPDLNFENPRVQQAIFRAMDFWLDLGVDGLRLDAVPYLYERDGTNCENLPETHAFLKRLRTRIDERYRGRMLLAEANQWPEDSVAYFGEGDGDECQMAFHFPLMPRMFMAVRAEDRFPIVDILAQTPAIPQNAQWALFLRNHDELTLEMVTDEERDYMYRVYANDPQMRINVGIRRRLAPLLGNSRRRIELLNGLLFSLPGTPVVYYGDEIGMGDNVYLGDRNGVRTPMQWSGDRNAGFSTANSQALYLPVVTDPEFHFQAINVETQQANPESLLWWMKRLIALRRRYPAFGRGSLEFLAPDNRKVLAFLRRFGDEQILVIANLSRFSQPVELDLSAFAELAPIEMFGRVEFPVIGPQPYMVTVAPHGFYWFSLERPDATTSAVAPGELPRLRSSGTWESWLRAEAASQLGRLLPAYLRQRRWFRGKARVLTSTAVSDLVAVRTGAGLAVIAFVIAEYADGDPETYVLPLQFATGEDAQRIQAESAHAVIARFVLGETGAEGIVYDAVASAAFDSTLLDAIATRRRFHGQSGEIDGSPAGAFRELAGGDAAALTPSLARGEQSNSSIVFGGRLMLKLFRTLENGVNPDLEMARFLTEHAYPNVPRLAGWLSHRPERAQPAARGDAARRRAAQGEVEGEPSTLGILQEFVANEGDLWKTTLDALGVFLERAAAEPVAPDAINTSVRGLLALSARGAPASVHRLLNPYLDTAWLLGKRTAELHLVLASAPADPAFSPEPFLSQDQRSLYQSMHNQLRQTFLTLTRAARSLPEPLRAQARAVLEAQDVIEARYRALLTGRLTAQRIRVHGDYHLGQVLWTGRDVAIIDFEGEPTRPLGERRRKRSALVDVAGMLRSFHYAAYGALVDPSLRGLVRRQDVSSLEPWIATWFGWVAATFLRGYREGVGDASFMPREVDELERLLDAFVLEKAVFEISYELGSRPDWIAIPLRGVTELVGG